MESGINWNLGYISASLFSSPSFFYLCFPSVALASRLKCDFSFIQILITMLSNRLVCVYQKWLESSFPLEDCSIFESTLSPLFLSPSTCRHVHSLSFCHCKREPFSLIDHSILTESEVPVSTRRLVQLFNLKDHHLHLVHLLLSIHTGDLAILTRGKHSSPHSCLDSIVPVPIIAMVHLLPLYLFLALVSISVLF